MAQDYPNSDSLDANSVKVHFQDYPNIYFREPIGYRSSVHQPIAEQRHKCLFCKHIIVGSIFDHLRKVHEGETEVSEIKRLDNCPEDTEAEQKYKLFNRQRLFGILRNHGDHIHNTEVVRHGSGELFLSRRPSGSGPHYVRNYSNCPDCFTWVLDLHKHRLYQQHCPTSLDKPTTMNDICQMARARKDNNGNAQSTSPGNGLQTVRKLTIVEVFSTMKSDEITRIVRSDVLIHAVGVQGLSKTNQQSVKVGKARTTLRNTLSLRMRLCAKILRRCRDSLRDSDRDYSNALWMDIIVPTLYDIIVTSVVQEVCVVNPVPARAVKFGRCLSHMCKTKLNIALTDRNNSDVKDARELLTLVEARWHEAVHRKCEMLFGSRIVSDMLSGVGDESMVSIENDIANDPEIEGQGYNIVTLNQSSDMLVKVENNDILAGCSVQEASRLPLIIEPIVTSTTHTSTAQTITTPSEPNNSPEPQPIQLEPLRMKLDSNMYGK